MHIGTDKIHLSLSKISLMKSRIY